MAMAVPSWADATRDTEQKAQLGAGRKVSVVGRVVQMGTDAVVGAVRWAVMGTANFMGCEVGAGLLHYNCDGSWPRHCVYSH